MQTDNNSQGFYKQGKITFKLSSKCCYFSSKSHQAQLADINLDSWSVRLSGNEEIGQLAKDVIANNFSGSEFRYNFFESIEKLGQQMST